MAGFYQPKAKNVLKQHLKAIAGAPRFSVIYLHPALTQVCESVLVCSFLLFYNSKQHFTGLLNTLGYYIWGNVILHSWALGTYI